LLRAHRSLHAVNLTVVGVARGARHAPGVEFLGVVRDRHELGELFDAADFLVVPSFAEGLPTVILEALARGLPVIASDVGAVREAVLEGETGFLVHPGNVAELGSALTAALRISDDEYVRMSAACNKLFSDKFSPRSVKRKFISIIDGVAIGSR
jgi:glycosyltransferase involved in cell wall biosynthesis